MHEHGSPFEFAVLLMAGCAVLAYVSGVVASRRRGRAWPLYRVVFWTTGIASATASVIGPLAAAAHESFVAHMWAHLLVGMLAPLLLVSAAPTTLALRTLDVTPARRLSRLLRSTPTRIVAHPVSAAVLSVGGLWFIYLTPVVTWSRSNVLIHLVMHAHLLAAGYLFTAALVGLDPRPHPPRRSTMLVVMVFAFASHGILAKYLYGHPPIGIAASDAEDGAQVMYYVGAWIEAAVIIVFFAHWYREVGRRLVIQPSSP
ncbi:MULTISPECIES: cytochrome c oxidase assembly protein [unclassified Leifsonia]|uniref:cytochrome c oxidase assembly protein n=1 Tax=unclassified Leifsonia TaxID=2663824 RepID=UPI000B0B1410|nr:MULTISPECIES: cytochrome c oxidase assembly protein [unclassified Leifsonia]